MRTIFFLVASNVFMTLAISQGLPEGLFLGAKAPDFKMTDQFGREVQFRSEAKSQKAVVVFTGGIGARIALVY